MRKVLFTGTRTGRRYFAGYVTTASALMILVVLFACAAL
jgi:hypothetical protein